MKEEDMQEKYKKEIEDLNNAAKELDEVYLKFHEGIELVFEYFSRIEGELNSLLEENEIKYHFIELFTRVKEMYKIMDVFYRESLANRHLLNIANLRLYILFKSLDEIEEIKSLGLKEKMEIIDHLTKKVEYIDEHALTLEDLEELADSLKEQVEKNKGNQGAEIV